MYCGANEEELTAQERPARITNRQIKQRADNVNNKKKNRFSFCVFGVKNV